MNGYIRYIHAICLVAALLLSCCIRDGLGDTDPGVPRGYVSLEPRFVVAGEKQYSTRASGDLINYIEDVHIFVFDGDYAQETSPGVWELPDNTPISVRTIYNYDAGERKLYLRSRESYYIFVLANLDDRYVPGGDVEAFLAGITTYGDLKNLYVQAINYSAEEVGKMMMSTGQVVPIILPGEDEVFVPEVPLERLRSQFVVTVYNKVSPAGEILSGVYPSTISFGNVPRYGYVMERAVASDNSHDKAFSLGEGGYYHSTTNLLPEPSSTPERITVISSKTGLPVENYYTRQQLTFYCLENRRGEADVAAMEQWVRDYASQYAPWIESQLPGVYARREFAPELSTFASLTSLTDEGILNTYFYAGKGRDYEATTPGADEAFNNYDVDRNSIYHFNVYINGIQDVTVDSRRELLEQKLFVNHSDDFERLDAHYMDVPVYVQGRTGGYFRMEAGIDTDPTPGIGWSAMSNLPPQERWLTMSWHDPYPGDDNVEGAVEGVIAVGPDGLGEVTPILHLDEYVSVEDAGSFPAGAVEAVNNHAVPPRRTAQVRVGFVEGALDATAYELGVTQGRVSYLTFDVVQHGLKTVGQLGGYIEGEGYQALLGVESVEEYHTQFYLKGDKIDRARPGLPWRYIYGPGAGSAEGQYTFDGLGATRYRYGEYRRSNNYPGGVPPKRGDVNTAPVTAPYPDLVYNPFSNTNAVDYCVRKNRDADGNGIIDDDELKWYLPTPTQMTQIFYFRNSFRGNEFSLNQVGYESYEPLGGLSPLYWTTAEETNMIGEPNSYVVDFSQQAARITSSNKNSNNYVRCVRDVPAPFAEEPKPPMFYLHTDSRGNTIVVANLTDHMDEGLINDNKYAAANGNNPRAQLESAAFNNLGRSFAVSRWYAWGETWDGSGGPLDIPQTTQGTSYWCNTSYSEPGYPVGEWYAPSGEELVLISSLGKDEIEPVLREGWGNVPGRTTWHGILNGENHWAITNPGGNNARRWLVNTGTPPYNDLAHKNTPGYLRCVRYFPSDDIPAPND